MARTNKKKKSKNTNMEFGEIKGNQTKLKINACPVSRQLLSLLENADEYFMAWHKIKFSKPLNLHTKDVILSHHCFKDPDKPRRLEDIGNFQFCKSYSLGRMASYFVEAYVLMNGEMLEKAQETLVIAEALYLSVLKKGLITPEYAAGLVHLNYMTLLHLKILKGNIPQDEPSYASMNANDEFRSLPKGAKAVVWRAKELYLKMLEVVDTGPYNKLKAIDISISIFKQMAQIDPEYFEWPYTLTCRLRIARRQYGEGDYEHMPSMEESKLLWDTYTLLSKPKSPENTIALLRVCQSVAECIRATYPAVKRICFGDLYLVFDDFHEALDFIYDEITNILNNAAYSSIRKVEYVIAGDIFSSILPRKLRDYELADLCFKRASEVADGSKLKHKMGCLYVVSESHRDIQRAITCFRESVNQIDSNIPATIDLLQALIGFATGDQNIRNEIILHLNEVQQKPGFTPWHLYMITSLRGAFHYVLEQYDEAIIAWVQAMKVMKNLSTGNIFKFLKSASHRYKWRNWRIFRTYEIRERLLNHLLTTYGERFHHISSVDELLETLGKQSSCVFQAMENRRSRETSNDDGDDMDYVEIDELDLVAEDLKEWNQRGRKESTAHYAQRLNQKFGSQSLECICRLD